jgi:dolichol kinase
VSVATGLALIVFSVGLLLAAMAAVKALARLYDLGPELQRKLVHVATGLYALTLPLTFHDRWPVVTLIAVSVAVLYALRLPRFARGGFASALHGVERQSHGEIYLCLAVGFLFFQSQREPALFVAPVLTLTLADAAAALIGTSYGRKRFPVAAGYKSVEGVATFFVVTWLSTMIVLLLLTDSPRATVVMLSFLTAAFGAFVEASSWRGLDNLFIPLSIYFLLAGRLNAPVGELCALAIIFLSAITIISRFAPKLKLSLHAARAYGVLVFLICAIADPQHAIFPVLVIFGHLAAERKAPAHSDFPDLDLVGAIAGGSAAWLFLGRYFGHSAIDCYDLTFAAMTAIYVVLTFGRRERWAIAILLPVLAAAAFASTGWNHAEADWHGLFWPWIGAAIAVAAGAAAAAPWLYERHRALRAFAVAAATPLALFVWKGVLT